MGILKMRYKRIVAFCLSVIMVAIWMFGAVQHDIYAAERIPSKVNNFYYYTDGYGMIHCTTDERIIYDSYDAAIKGIAEVSRKIYIERKYQTYGLEIPVEIKCERTDAISTNGAEEFEQSIQKETFKETGNPDEGRTLEWFALNKGNLYADNPGDKITYVDSSYKGKFCYDNAGYYHVSNERYEEAKAKAENVIESLDLAGKSDYDKCKVIMRWISENVKYDHHYYGTKEEEAAPAKTEYPYDMTGPLLDGYGVCEGYAKTFYYFTTAAGMNVLYENGDSHAWNLIELNGTYYYIDPTNTHFKDGEPTLEFLYGKESMQYRFKPYKDDIENTYQNISNDDYSKEHSICKGNHHLEYSGERYATCSQGGYRHSDCMNNGCFYEEKVKTTEALGHSWELVSVTQQQSCTKAEITTYKCARCGETKAEETKPSLGGHKWNEGKVTTEPTCTKPGERTCTCSVCQETKIEKTEKTGHNYEKTSTTATCTTSGAAIYTCKNCGGTVRRSDPATGHQHTEIRDNKDATCTKAGYTGDTYCVDCGKKLSSGTVIEKMDHEWVQQETTPANCTTGKIQNFKCEKCGEVKRVPIGNPLGHLHKEIRNVKAATCEKTGYTGDTYCKDCETLLEKGIAINALGHDWDNGKITKEPTGKENGIKTFTCRKCKQTKTEEIPMQAHHWDSGIIIKESTCTEDGKKKFTCTDEGCNETYTVAIPAVGHQHTVVHNKKDATCTKDGYTGDTYCKDCKQVIKAGDAIKAVGHKWGQRKTAEATCTANGRKTFVCADCGEEKTETLSATGHHFSNWKTILAATVFAPCSQKRVCFKCGKAETRTSGSKLKANIKISATSLKLKKKQSTKKLIVTGLAKGDSVKSWTTSNKKIVTISGRNNGSCTIKAGSKTGTAKIMVTLASGLKKTVTVKVQKGAVACTSIKSVPKKLTIKRKKGYQLRPVINPITCTYKVKYKTSNKKIVKVNSKGKITAVKKGKAKITITVGKKKIICSITVK